jgi:predicted adenine nucleotide alpha hydrolase (AANH) superfamily ATPase
VLHVVVLARYGGEWPNIYLYEHFFYNPNIHPIEEYELRKQENMRYADKLGMSFIDADYDIDVWFERTKGQEMSLNVANVVRPAST